MPAQNAALAAAGLGRRRTRFGRRFERHLASLRISAGWDRARIEAHQDARVAALVSHAYHTTRYYRRAMDAAGVRPDDVRGVADLARLPVLTKEDIRDNFDDLVSSTVRRRRLIPIQTSGSTGAPLTLLTNPDALAFKWAVWWRHREWFGVRRKDLHLNVTTKPLVSTRQTEPPFWRWNRLERQAILPMQQVKPDAVAAIVDFLDRTPFVFYSGYPSILHSLAVHAADQGLSVSEGPAVVFTGAEGVVGRQRRDVETFTGAPLAEMYGFNEGAGNASTCPEGNLHEDFEFGHLERGVSASAGDGGLEGSILATGFSNLAFPLIRYDVGDVATWHPASFRCPCGRESRVISAINGRWEDYIVTPEGHQARRLGEIFKAMPLLKQFQLVQDDPGRVTLRLAVKEGFGPEEERILRRRVATWISGSLAVDFEYAEAIPPAPNGKYQRIVSALSPGRAPE